MANREPGPVITVSASYGAGGSVIAPALAERFGWPFIDRVILQDPGDHPRPAPPAEDENAAAQRVSGESAPECHSTEGLAEGEQGASFSSRILTYLARAASVGALYAPEMVLDSEEQLRERSEAELWPVMEGQSAVVLGRAAAIVLRQRPNTFHIRLDGPTERRASRGARIEGTDIVSATEQLNRTDKARTLWVRQLYHEDATSPYLYHLWLDTTVFPRGRPADIIVDAAEMFFKGDGPSW